MLSFVGCVTNLESDTLDSNQKESSEQGDTNAHMKEQIEKGESGHLASQYALVQHYMSEADETGNPIHVEKAMYWMEKVADNQNDPQLQLILGEGYHYGAKGIKRDFTKAANWYEKAASNGSADAMDYLGLFHNRGLGGKEKSCVEAVKWYELAFASGFEQSENNIAYTYAIQESEIRYRNMLKKVKLYEKNIPARGPESAKPEDYGGY